MSPPPVAGNTSADTMSASLDVLESATGLLRSAQSTDFFYYYAGTLPFLWLLVDYCSEMSHGVHAAQHLWPGACTLAMAYVWMKAGQALFVQRLLFKLREDERHWTLRERLRVVRRAAIVQSSALTVTCFATCLLIPTAWTFAFYHHALCTCDADQPDFIAGVRAALKQSQLWPRQNHALLTIHAVFGLTVFVNVWVLLLFIPQLLQTLVGVETRFLDVTESPWNSTVILTAAVVTLALTDPWLKAAYAVRVFRAQSTSTGRDLTVAWRRAAHASALISILACLSLPHLAAAQTPKAEASTSSSFNREVAPQRTAQAAPSGDARDSEAEKLDRQLNAVLERPDFSWHMPRDTKAEPDDERESSWLYDWLRGAYHSIGAGLATALRWLGRIVQWFLRSSNPSELSESSASNNWGVFADRTIAVLAIVAIAVPLALLFRRKSRKQPPATPSAPSTKSDQSADNEGLEAAKRPESDWLRQAETLLQAGERRLALRALFLGNLACLMHAGYVTAAAHKSVGDYRRDLRGRAHSFPQTFKGFCDTALIFESVWYGNHPVTDTLLDQFSRGSALLRQNVCRGRLALLAVVALFAWGMFSLLQTRFGFGDVYPPGSSFRSDALGIRAIHDVIAEALPRNVVRLRGRQSELRNIGQATVIVQGLSFATLVIQKDPLVEDLTLAASRGARLVVTLNDSEAMTCREQYCNETHKTRCTAERSPYESADAPEPSTRPSAAQPGSSAPQIQKKQGPEAKPTEDTSCETAALGLWGFEIGGTKDAVAAAKLATASPAQLPARLPWHGPAHFIDMNPDFKAIYTRGNDVLVAERTFGKGSIVLLADGYLLSNQAQREARQPEFLLWLLGNNPHVAFEESHLGVVERRGIMSLLRELRLQGFLFGCFVVAFLFAWQRWRPLARASTRHEPAPAATVSDSTLLTLLRRCMTPRQALLACVQEAQLAQLGKVVERARKSKLSPSPAEFNRNIL